MHSSAPTDIQIRAVLVIDSFREARRKGGANFVIYEDYLHLNGKLESHIIACGTLNAD
jgi:hypothetical protein